jgi:hypothetical protein
MDILLLSGNENMMKKVNNPQIRGWIAVGLSTLITCFWAFWGIIENFHEGWYYASWLSNLGLMFIQYLSPMLIFIVAALISIYKPRIGSGLHIIIVLLAAWFFNVASNAGIILLLIPLIGIGALYWFGRPEPRKTALWITIGFPILTLIIAGLGPILRVSQRIDDGILEARLVDGNEVHLLWAPAGPGWPSEGDNWNNAQIVCNYLNEDGLTIAPELQNIWRLPSVDEAVRSMSLHGENSVGAWDSSTAKATYKTNPDKESPLWDTHSQVIYWWTATEIDEGKAYIIAYDGKVWPRSKDIGPDYLGFRCVTNPFPE